MLILYILSILLLIGGTVMFRLGGHKRVLLIVSIAMIVVGLAGSFGIAFPYGRKLFQNDDPHLGGWIFFVGALFALFSCGFAFTYVNCPILSKVFLALAFIVLGILFVMCIYEGKVVFKNGINSNSPGLSSEDSTSSLSLLFPLSAFQSNRG